MSEVVDAKELAARLHVSKDTIHVWNRRGIIPSIRASRRTIRFDVAKVMQALEAKAEPREVVHG